MLTFLALPEIPAPLLRYLIWPTVKFLIAFIIVQVIVAGMTYIERRVLGFMQARLGPNRVGPWGLLQAVADPIKLMLKEDIVPAGADRGVFLIAPVIGIIAAFA